MSLSLYHMYPNTCTDYCQHEMRLFHRKTSLPLCLCTTVTQHTVCCVTVEHEQNVIQDISERTPATLQEERDVTTMTRSACWHGQIHFPWRKSHFVLASTSACVWVHAVEWQPRFTRGEAPSPSVGEDTLCRTAKDSMIGHIIENEKENET